MNKDFGAYELRRKLGHGGMATVWLAVQKALDRQVAIKILFPHLAEDENLVQRFQHEARAVAQMRHSNIVQIFDYGTHEGSPFIAMEFVEGSNLMQWLTDHGPPPIEVALVMLRDVCLGLEHAHGRSVIHRDIKPSNVMLTPEGTIKLMDFGLARRTEDQTQMTVPGTMLGSPAYMSPEQAMGNKVDLRTDIFSLGVVCYELLGGERPFQGETLSAVTQAILNVAPRPLELVNPLVPARLAEVIRSALEKDATRRCSTVAEVYAALNEALTELGVERKRELLVRYAAAPEKVAQELRQAAGRPEPVRRPSDAEETMVLPPPGESRSQAPAPVSPPPPPPALMVAPPLSATPPQLGPPAAPLPPTPAPPPAESEPPVEPRPHTPGTRPAESRPPAAPPLPPPPTPAESRPTAAPRPAAPATPPARRTQAPNPARSPKTATPPPLKPPSRGPMLGTRPLIWTAGALVVAIAVFAGILIFSGGRSKPGEESPAIPEAPAGADTTGIVSSGGEADPARIAASPVNRDSVRRDSRRPDSAATAARPARTRARVTVNATPAGAMVQWDAAEALPAPALVRNVAAGEHRVRVTHDGHVPIEETVRIAMGRDTTLEFALARVAAPAPVVARRASVIAHSEPVGARFRLDGGEERRSPATWRRIESGTHTLGAAMEGYEPTEVTFNFSAGADTQMRVALRRVSREPSGPGHLVLRGPSGTLFFRNGEAIPTQGDSARLELPAGAHRVSWSHPRYRKTYQAEARVRAGKATVLWAKFVGYVVAKTEDNGPAEILVNGEPAGRAGATIELEPGSYRIEARRDGVPSRFGAQEIKLDLNQTQMLRFSFAP